MLSSNTEEAKIMVKVKKRMMGLFMATLLMSMMVSAYAKEPAVSGKVMIYTSSEDAFISEVVTRFNKKYPNVKAEYYRSGTEEVISKLMAEKQTNSIRCDLLMVSDTPTFEMLKKDGMMVRYNSSELKNIYQEYVDPERMYYGTFPAGIGIMYNTNMVKTAPDSWLVLTSPSVKNNCIMPNPLYSGAAAYTLMALTAKKGIGWDYYQKLYDNQIMVVNGNGGVVNSVSSGEKAYGMVVDSNALAAAAKGAPVAFIYPKEGVPSIADPIGILKTTKNLAAAKGFLDFMLQDEVQTLGRDLIGKTPIRKGIAPPKGTLELSKRKLIGGDPKKMLLKREDEKKKFKIMFNL
jgi:iron(III) transport system substrate-binding protein